MIISFGDFPVDIDLLSIPTGTWAPTKAYQGDVGSTADPLDVDLETKLFVSIPDGSTLPMNNLGVRLKIGLIQKDY